MFRRLAPTPYLKGQTPALHLNGQPLTLFKNPITSSNQYSNTTTIPNPITHNTRRWFSHHTSHNTRPNIHHSKLLVPNLYHRPTTTHFPLNFQPSRTSLITISTRPFASKGPPRARPGWLASRVAKLRHWANRGTNDDLKWDPFDAKTRDITIGESNANVILKNAQMARQKQLEAIQKYQKKTADKEASIRTPIAYAAQKRAEKIPFGQRLKKVKEWIMNPKNYFGSFYKEHDVATLSFTQKCMYIYWRQSLGLFLLFFLVLPRIPIISDILDELSRHRNRKRRGVLGLDEYCTPTKQFTKLKFFRTNDWTFDINYLQKMTLRDIYVVKNITMSLKELTEERIHYLESIVAKLLSFESDPELKNEISNNQNRFRSSKNTNVRDLTPFQRDAVLNLTTYHETLSQELEQAKKFLENIKTEWIPQGQAAWDNTDVQITTLFSTYLTTQARRDWLLESTIKHQKGVEEWRTTLEEEYEKHLTRAEEVELLCSKLLQKDYIPWVPQENDDDNDSVTGIGTKWARKLKLQFAKGNKHTDGEKKSELNPSIEEFHTDEFQTFLPRTRNYPGIKHGLNNMLEMQKREEKNRQQEFNSIRERKDSIGAQKKYTSQEIEYLMSQIDTERDTLQQVQTQASKQQRGDRRERAAAMLQAQQQQPPQQFQQQDTLEQQSQRQQQQQQQQQKPSQKYQLTTQIGDNSSTSGYGSQLANLDPSQSQRIITPRPPQPTS